jgi:asparagine synthase (glutamine-hydrolysing)
MCGIAGIYNIVDRKASPQRLREMIRLLCHRGPDASGCYLDGKVGLAHARLSIIDLQEGGQPMSTDDGRLVVTFNGEIFNYIELRQSLIQLGHRFRTESDTEVILHAYRQYGERCVEHFNGQWALAIWDKQQRKLFLSRDRLGIRPLFTTCAGGRFLFASEIKSLFVHPEVPRELDPDGMRQMFTYWSTLAPTTIFQGIQELPPGHNLVVQDGRVELRKYWQLDYKPSADSISTHDWADQLRILLEDATRLRLRADVPVGAYLSGGLDSSITAALASRISGERLRTFSVTFEEDEFDESSYQRQVARKLGVEHESMHCTRDDIAEVFPDVIWHAEKPMLRTAPAPLYLLSKRVHAAEFKVVLTGEGADELLGGYGLFKEAKVRRFCARQADSVGRTALLEKLYPYLPNLQRQSVPMRRAFFRIAPELLDHPCYSHLPRWEMTAGIKQFFNPDFLCQEGQPKGEAGSYAEVVANLPADYAQWSPFCQSQFLESTILMPGYILSTQGDRMAMAHSVEGRYPFLDHRLAEFAATIPPRLKMSGLKEKYLLKRAMGDLVPKEVVQRTKQPYRAPDGASFFRDDWLSARAPYVDSLLAPARIKADGIFQPEGVARLLRKARAGKLASMRDNMALVGILSTQLLVDRLVRNFPVPRELKTIAPIPAPTDYSTNPVS